jgi:hypothetical protein
LAITPPGRLPVIEESIVGVILNFFDSFAPILRAVLPIRGASSRIAHGKY